MTDSVPGARLLFPALRWSAEGGFGPLDDEIGRALDLGVGGFILFGGEAAAVADLVSSLRARSRTPLLIGADLERGAGQQFRGCTALPPLWALGALGDLDALWRAGELTAREARALGVDWVYAPVADLGNEPRNPIVATRALGADPHQVAKGVVAWSMGCRAGGALACVKHFPGHGRTVGDSHLELPAVREDARSLADDLIPFAAAVHADVPSVMSAHVAFPALDPEGLPATRSRAIVGGLLRGRLGFGGVVVTDALIMEGAASGTSDAAAAVQAVRAGVDALLYPKDPGRLARALDDEAAADPAFGDHLRESAARLDAMRERLPGPPEGAESRSGPPWGAEADRRWAGDTALRTVKLLRPSPAPLRWPFSLVTIDDDLGGPYPPPSRHVLPETLRRLGVQVRDGEGDAPGDDAGSRLVAVYADVRGWKGRVGLSEGARERVAAALSGGAPSLVILFSHPWNATEIAPEAGLACAWGGEALMQEAAARFVARLTVG